MKAFVIASILFVRSKVMYDAEESYKDERSPCWSQYRAVRPRILHVSNDVLDMGNISQQLAWLQACHATIPCLAFALGHRADVLLPALPGQPGGLMGNIAHVQHVIADMQIPRADNALTGSSKV